MHDSIRFPITPPDVGLREATWITKVCSELSSKALGQRASGMSCGTLRRQMLKYKSGANLSKSASS